MKDLKHIKELLAVKQERLDFFKREAADEEKDDREHQFAVEMRDNISIEVAILEDNLAALRSYNHLYYLEHPRKKQDDPYEGPDSSALRDADHYERN